MLTPRISHLLDDQVVGITLEALHQRARREGVVDGPLLHHNVVTLGVPEGGGEGGQGGEWWAGVRGYRGGVEWRAGRWSGTRASGGARDCEKVRW